VQIAVPGGVGHFAQLSLQRAKSWVLRLIEKTPLELVYAESWSGHALAWLRAFRFPSHFDQISPPDALIERQHDRAAKISQLFMGKAVRR
jgi:hypothetical protein